MPIPRLHIAPPIKRSNLPSYRNVTKRLNRIFHLKTRPKSDPTHSPKAPSQLTGKLVGRPMYLPCSKPGDSVKHGEDKITDPITLETYILDEYADQNKVHTVTLTPPSSDTDYRNTYNIAPKAVFIEGQWYLAEPLKEWLLSNPTVPHNRAPFTYSDLQKQLGNTVTSEVTPAFQFEIRNMPNNTDLSPERMASIAASETVLDAVASVQGESANKVLRQFLLKNNALQLLPQSTEVEPSQYVEFNNDK